MRKRKSVSVLLCLVLIFSMSFTTFAEEPQPEQTSAYQLSLPAEIDYSTTYGEIKAEIDNYLIAKGLSMEVGTEDYQNLMYQILYDELPDLNDSAKDYFSAYAAHYVNCPEISEDYDVTLLEEKNANLEEQENAKAAAIPQTRAVNYNISSAQYYAYLHYQVYNPAYPSFSSDCTNFASQILNAGGFPYASDWNVFASTSSAAYVNWVNASSFAQYWSLIRGYAGAGCSTRAQVNANANPGDFIAYMSSTTYEIWHIAFVQSKSNGLINITQHTANFYNQRFNDRGGSNFMNENSVLIIDFT